jgi:putative DNA primase/helicase
VILNAEDAPEDTILPRILASRGDPSRVFVIRGTKSDTGDERHFNLDADVNKLTSYVRDRKDIRLVIIDPITSYLGKVQMNDEAEVRGLLGPLNKLARECHIAVVLVAHLNKKQDLDKISRVTGAMAFVGLARAAFILERTQGQEDQRNLLPLKSNLSKDSSGLLCAIRSVPFPGQPALERGNRDSIPIVEWLGPIDDGAPSDGRPQSRKDHAQLFLQMALANGPRLAREVEAEAGRAGISEATLRRAREDVRIVTKKEKGGEGRSIWSLPVETVEQAEQVEQVSQCQPSFAQLEQPAQLVQLDPPSADMATPSSRSIGGSQLEGGF